MRRKSKRMSGAVLAGAASLILTNPGLAALTIVETKVGTETVNGGVTYDVIDFNLASLTGLDADSNPSYGGTGDLADPGIDALDLTFTASVANSLGVPGVTTASNKAYFGKFLSNSLPSIGGSNAVPGSVATGAYDYSFVNLDEVISPARSNSGSGTISGSNIGGVTGNSTSFSATWYTTTTAIEPASGVHPNPLIAQILVLHGEGYGISFTGQYVADAETAPEDITFPVHNPPPPPPSGRIISFITTGAPTGTAPNGYGAAPLGTLTVTNAGGPGKYFPGYFNIAGGAATGFIAVKGFLPADTPEIYALQVAISGVELLPTDTRLATIIADIEAADTNISSGVTTVLGSPYAAIFPGYDIIVPTSIAGGETPYFAWDFSSPTDPDSALGAVTVTSIAAVPEPAAMAGVIIGCVGLLIGRRGRRIVQA